MTDRIIQIALVLSISCCFPFPCSGAVPDKPNFVIVYCDDQGYQDLGCFGSPNIKTPNVDRLAEEGIRFTDFYSAYCVCSASRASLLTGCYQPRISMRGVLGPHAEGSLDSTRGMLHPNEVTIADMLKSRGYATAMVGKWHVGDSPETLPTAQGFDSYFGIPYSNDMARMKGWGNNPLDLDKIWSLKKWDIYNNELYRDKEIIESPVNQVTITDRYTSEALTFIRANKDKPFFLHLAQTMPHVPLFVSDARYDPDPHQAYRLTIEHIDWSVGQIMQTLDQLQLSENTFIVYTSDNGPWLNKKHHGGSALPLRAGKSTTYEGGMRVPCVMRWPAGIKPGQICSQVASTIDLLPTFAKIAGATLDASRPIDGRDVGGLLKDPTSESPHEKTGFYYFRNSRLEAIRLGDWKLHFKLKLELYNLREDISETNNLVNTKPELVRHMITVAERYHANLKANTRPAWSGRPRSSPDK